MLGISSLGYLVEYGSSKGYNKDVDLFLDATRDCLLDCEKFELEICELVLEPPVVFSNENREKFIELCNSFKIKKQLHGPFVDLGLCSLNRRISLASLNSYIESIKIGKIINSKRITIHPGVGNFLIPALKQKNDTVLIQRVKELLNSLKFRSQKVCIENMPKNANMLLNVKELKTFLSNFKNNILYLTYDTSHFWTCDGNLSDLWRELHPLIENIHLVDNFTKEKDTHQCLGSGKIDFQDIFYYIRKYNYEGPLIIELSAARDIPKSIEFLRKLIL